MGSRVLIGGTAYDVKGGRVLINGTAYSIDKGKTMIDGTIRTISFARPAASLPVGSSVYMNVGGVRTEFLIVHQGNPDSSFYDVSCNGTWVLMKDIYNTRQWSQYNLFDYENSLIHAYLNDEFFSLLDSSVKNTIKQAKIPYAKRVSNNSSFRPTGGADGLTTKVFVLSDNEVNWGRGAGTGAALTYFPDNTSAEIARRIAYLNGVAASWGLRTNMTDSVGAYIYTAAVIGPTGGLFQTGGTAALGVRPAMILSADAKVDNQFNLT